MEKTESLSVSKSTPHSQGSVTCRTVLGISIVAVPQNETARGSLKGVYHGAVLRDGTFCTTQQYEPRRVEAGCRAEASNRWLITILRL